MQRNPAKLCMRLGRRRRGVMEGGVEGDVQSLSIERAENFGKVLGRHIPEALQPRLPAPPPGGVSPGTSRHPGTTGWVYFFI